MKYVKLVIGCVFAASLLACGGGGGGGGDGSGAIGGPNSAVVQGAYSGTITGSPTSNGFQMVSLENGEVWALYGTASGSVFFVRGLIQGNVTFNGSSFSSSNARDFGVVPPPVSTLSGTISSTAVSGTASTTAGTISFSGTPIPASTFDYNAPATLAPIVGDWTLQGLDGTTASVSITSTGTFTGNNAGCLISGTIAPRASGKNVFNLTVVSGASPCATPGGTYTGIGLSYLISGTSQRQLIVAGVNGARTAGTAFVGTR